MLRYRSQNRTKGKTLFKRIAIAAGSATVALGALAGGIAAAGPASASPLPVETFTGVSHNVTSNVVQLDAQGPAWDHGFINLGTSGPKSTLFLSRGNIDVRHTTGQPSVKYDPAACTLTEVDAGRYAITGGTGAYRHADGFGTFLITSRARFATVGGLCPSEATLEAPSATPLGGETVFRAGGPLWGVTSYRDDHGNGRDNGRSDDNHGLGHDHGKGNDHGHGHGHGPVFPVHGPRY